MGTYIKFKGEITNGIALPFIQNRYQLSAAFIK